MHLARSLANLKREISEKKWVEARQWAGGRTSLRCVLSGRPNRKSRGRRCGRRLGSGRAGIRSGTSWPTGGVVRGCGTSSLLRRWEGGCRLRKTR